MADAPDYGGHLADAARALKSGPLSDIPLMSRLSPADLRRGAQRAEDDARFRRALADRLEAHGLPDIQVSEALKLSEEADHG